ncbi:MBL fold metallo-hydrolase [candidate division KSB1 bacterium]|nr:MBL fold metallo-hydrolase [candidate division KSB1 bacterium]
MVDLSHFNNPDTNQLNATWIGHSSLMINIDGYKIMTDPVFENKISPFGPTRFSGDVPLIINDIPQVDVVIISHNHYDHLNKFSVKFLKDRTKLFITTLGVKPLLVKWGIPADKIIELDWWDEYQVTDNLMIAATPSQHFSGRGLFDREKTLWASWVIKATNHRVYFSADSGYWDGFKQIGKKYGPFDINFIECGAYNEAWYFVHMFPEQTVQAHLDLGGKIVQPIHWGTFNLSLHPWYEPMQRFTKAADSLGLTCATPIVGETTIFNGNIPNQRWWEPFIEKH